MQPFIKFEKVWCDEDTTELKVTVNNGQSSFSNIVSLGNNELSELSESLEVFKTQYYGGLKDVQFGRFGREFVNGGFHARMHFPEPGYLYIATTQQSKFLSFKGQEVASEAKMFLRTEPCLLDNFLLELKQLSKGDEDAAQLLCI